jgi:hypothetical protein
MADNGIFATTAEVGYKAGINASSVSNTEAYINDFMTQAESEINTLSQFNWTDVYTSLNVDVRGILKLAASSRAAMWVINYDADVIGRKTAELRLDVLNDDYQRALSLLRDIKKRDFINGA